MQSRAVTLVIRYKDGRGKWCRRAAARGANGRVKPGHALIDGKATAVSSYSYEIRRIVNRQPEYLPAGKSAAVAEAQRVRLEQSISVLEAAKGTDVEVSLRTERRSLKETATEYIRDAEGRRAMEAASQARLVSSEFIEQMRKKNKSYIDEIGREDIIGFHAALRARGCGERTVANKHMRLTSWLRFAGIDREKLPPTPRYEEKLPTVYTSEQMRTLLNEADTYMRMALLLGLKCGLRDQELMHLAFADIQWVDRTLRVQSKDEWQFRPKTWEQREIPIPEDVMLELRAWEAARPGHALVLGTRNRKLNSKLLRGLKQLAKNAGLNCGRCAGCQELGECREFTLHRLRRTYLTTLLRNGIDLRTVQAYAGHKDLTSTMRYLRPATGIEAQVKLNAVQW